MAEWNNTFPLDHWWRKKHNIPYNSLDHKSANQLDIYFEWLEEQMFEEYQKQIKIDDENIKLYDKGILLKEQKIEEEDDNLFDKIDVRVFNNQSPNFKIEE